MESRVLTTGYRNPDLDGTACAIAYAELLNQTGHNPLPVVFGAPLKEVPFALEKFSVSQPVDGDATLQATDQIVILDTSFIAKVSSEIKPEQVIEVIDHRIISETSQYPNAQIQIEQVGSCATLIAERFDKAKLTPSASSAALLYSAILSNTINFQASVTTDRDRRMSQWLLNYFELPDNLLHDLYAAKSAFTHSAVEVIDDGVAIYEIAGTRLGIAQIEIVDVAEFLSDHQTELSDYLERSRVEHSLDMIFLTAIDAGEGSNTFLAVDPQSQNLLQQSLGVVFTGNTAIRPGVLMRKTLAPMLKEFLETHPAL